MHRPRTPPCAALWKALLQSVTFLSPTLLFRASSNSIPRSLQAANVTCISGIPLSHGIAQGKVVVLRTMALSSTVNSAVAADLQQELERIKEAVSAVRHRIGERLKYAITPIGAGVLQADLAMASDVLLLEKLTEQVLGGKSAAEAVIKTGEFFTDLLGHSENDYIRQRSIDIEEICTQLLEEVCGASPTPTVELKEPSVLVAETIGPQQLLELNRGCLQALVLEHFWSYIARRNHWHVPSASLRSRAFEMLARC